jgi:hypothetical protein
LIAIDDRRCSRNLVNSLTRRREAYHEEIGRETPQDDGQAHTIHGQVISKEAHLERFLVYDRWERVALVDRFFRSAPTPIDLVDGGLGERGDFAGGRYRIAGVLSDGRVGGRVAREGRLDGDDRNRIALEKTVLLAPGDDGFDVEIRLRSLAAAGLSFHFGVEWIVNMLAGRAHDRYVLIDGTRPEDPALAAAGDHPGVQRLSFIDGWLGERVDIDAPGADGWIRNALETVSLSEAGAERIYQGTVALPHWSLTLDPGAERVLTMRVGLRHGESVGDP